MKSSRVLSMSWVATTFLVLEIAGLPVSVPDCGGCLDPMGMLGTNCPEGCVQQKFRDLGLIPRDSDMEDLSQLSATAMTYLRMLLEHPLPPDPMPTSDSHVPSSEEEDHPLDEADYYFDAVPSIAYPPEEYQYPPRAPPPSGHSPSHPLEEMKKPLDTDLWFFLTVDPNERNEDLFRDPNVPTSSVTFNVNPPHNHGDMIMSNMNPPNGNHPEANPSSFSSMSADNEEEDLSVVAHLLGLTDLLAEMNAKTPSTNVPNAETPETSTAPPTTPATEPDYEVDNEIPDEKFNHFVKETPTLLLLEKKMRVGKGMDSVIFKDNESFGLFPQSSKRVKKVSYKF